MRLIDADALERAIKTECNPYGRPTIDFESGKKVLKIIDNAPTIEERPKGKWIIDGHHIRCNRCNEYICNTDSEGNTIPDNFCPNCGADMRGDV